MRVVIVEGCLIFEDYDGKKCTSQYRLLKTNAIFHVLSQLNIDKASFRSMLATRSKYDACLLHASTVKQTATKSCDLYQPVASLHFLVSKLQLSDGPVNMVQCKTM